MHRSQIDLMATLSQKLMEIKQEDQLFDALKEFVEGLYFKYLAVNPRDRKVLIVESILSAQHFRSILAKVLFKHFEVLEMKLRLVCCYFYFHRFLVSCSFRLI